MNFGGGFRSVNFWYNMRMKMRLTDIGGEVGASLRLAALVALMTPAAVADGPRRDYAADAAFVRAYRDGAVAIARRKMADDAAAREKAGIRAAPRLSTGGSFSGLFLWDTAFCCIWAARLPKGEFPAAESLDSLYRLALDDGYVSREFTASGLPVWSDRHPVSFAPPLLSWAECELFEHGHTDLARLRRVVLVLARHHEACKRRFRRADGLYFGDMLGSGMDELPRWPVGKKIGDCGEGGIGFTREMLCAEAAPFIWEADWFKPLMPNLRWNRQAGWIDLSAQMALDARCLATLARRIGADEFAAAYAAEHAELAAAINRLCWDEATGFYYDRGPDGLIMRRHAGAFWTLLAGVATGERAARLALAALDEKGFGRPCGLPALPADDPDYLPETGYWRGVVWPPTTYMTVRGLAAAGHRDAAETIARRWYGANAALWEKYATCFENISPDQCDRIKVCSGRDFCGWAALAPIAIPVDFGFARAVPVSSPDGKVVCEFETVGGVPTLAVSYAGVPAGRLSVAVREGPFTLAAAKDVRTVLSSVKPVWGTAASYPENYRELEVSLKDDKGRLRDTVTVRAYNEGVAVRAAHETQLYSASYRDHEASAFAMPEGTVAWGIAKTEATFDRNPTPLVQLDGKAEWRMPLTMRLPGGVYASLFEANVRDYPRSNLRAEGWTLKPVFAKGGHERRGHVKTPWRVLLLAPSAGGLIERSQLVELLNDPCAIADTSWIKPGFCVSDMGNCRLVQEELVAAAKRAKAIGAWYLQLDWGWYGTEVPWSDDDRAAYREGKFKEVAAAHPGWEANTAADPRTVAKGHVPYHPTWPYSGRDRVDFDVAALAKELRQLDMGLCLYVHGYVLENCDLDELFALYESWGVAGLKPGFVSYGSQRSTEWMRTLAEVSARHRLWLDIHDAHIPDGFERTWPHVMTTEGGGGQEGKHPVRQDVALPFTRCLAGPFDYTPLFFDAKRTPAHMAAMLLAYPGPTAVLRGKVQDIAASPVADFVRALPWNYDETRVLSGEVADHLVIARRRGANWYLAGICGETPREITVDLAFLGEDGKFAETVTDDGGKRPVRKVTAADTLTLSMKAGGGACVLLAKDAL